jgi:hypothetical protein
MEREPFSLRYSAMATFAATMKLSIMSSATVRWLTARSFTPYFPNKLHKQELVTYNKAA